MQSDGALLYMMPISYVDEGHLEYNLSYSDFSLKSHSDYLLIHCKSVNSGLSLLMMPFLNKSKKNVVF